MGEIRFRLAKPSDAKQIANVHFHIRDKYDLGFFAQVNKSFLVQYYKVMLNDPNEVVVCAETETGQIVGFNSGSLDSSHQFDMMKKRKFSFVIPLLTSAISRPKLIVSAFDRMKSTSGKTKTHYIATEGARAEYWGWMPGRKDSDISMMMQERWLYIIKLLGAEKIFFEVDKINKKILKFHKINGAEELSSFTMPDGRERVEFVYNLNNYNFKI